MLLVAVVLACGGAFLAGRLLTAPVGQAAPRGPSHGATPEQIAATLVTSITAQLAAGSNATVSLSEQDLTIIAQQRNPDPAQFKSPTVVVSNGQLVVAATTSFGPFTVVDTAQVAVSLSGVGTAAPTILSTVTSFSIGREWVPAWLRSWFDSRGDAALSLDPVLNSSPALAQLRSLLECVDVGNAGVVIGFHRPGAVPDPAVCAGAPA